MALLTGNGVNSLAPLTQGFSSSPTLNLQNAQRLGLNNSNISVSQPVSPLQQSFQASAIATGALKPQTPPVSAVTQKPVTYAAAHASNPSASYTPTTTSSGSTVVADPNGNIASPSNFSIDTSGTTTSAAFNSPLSASDVMGSRKTYADYVNGLSQAQQYSPDYLAALQASQAAKAKESELNTNFYTGNNLPGDTLDYAQGSTARAIQLNSQKELAANQALQVQELIRQGNIAGAKALVDAYAPTSVSPGSSLVNPVTGQEQYSGLGGYQAVQGIQTVNNLAQTYPDANILPGDSLAIAQQKAQNAPSFQARQTYIQQLAGGQTISLNKLTGQYETIQGAGDASTTNAAAAVIKELTAQKSSTQAALTTADQNFPLLLQAAKQAGVNNSSPFVNQLQQKFGKNFSSSPAFAALQTLIPSLQSEYSRIIARGGSVDDNTRNSAAAIVNGNYSLAQLQAVYNTVKKEGANVLKGYDSAIAQQQALLSGGGSSSSGGTITTKNGLVINPSL